MKKILVLFLISTMAISIINMQEAKAFKAGYIEENNNGNWPKKNDIQCFKDKRTCLVNGRYISSPTSDKLIIEDDKVCTVKGDCLYTSAVRVNYNDGTQLKVQCFKGNKSCMVGNKLISSPNSEPLDIDEYSVCTSKGVCIDRYSGKTYNQ